MRARFRLEHGLLLGGTVGLAGFALAAVIVIQWIDRGFGALSEERLAVLAAALIVMGVQIFFCSFLLSILGLRRRSCSCGGSLPQPPRRCSASPRSPWPSAWPAPAAPST
jgi:hypothetical protein